MDPGSALLLNVHAWPRHRRIAMTGAHNSNYRHGRYTNKRRWRLEAPLNRAMRELGAFPLLRLQQRIARLPRSTAERARGLLERLGEYFPGRWALADPRRPEQRPAFYVPRRAWALCVRWLRCWREVQRLVFWGASLITPPMPTPIGEEKKGPLREGLAQGAQGVEARQVQHRRVLADYRAWCTHQGLTPPATT